MFHGSVWETRGRKYKITGLDILRYKLLNPNDYEEAEKLLLTKLQQDLDAVMRLFQSLRIKLPLKGECPQNIREELGPLINDIGEIARYKFVPAGKRYTIAHVMKYFGNGQPVTSKRDEERKDEDDNRKARRTFPYLNVFSFGITTITVGKNGRCYKKLVKSTYHDQDFKFETHSAPGGTNELARVNYIISNLTTIEDELRKISKPFKAENLRCFANKGRCNFKAEIPPATDT